MKRCMSPRMISRAVAGLVFAMGANAFAHDGTQWVEVQIQGARTNGAPVDISDIKAAQDQLVALGFEFARCGHIPAEGIFRLEVESDDDVRLLDDNGFDVISRSTDDGQRAGLVVDRAENG